MSVTSPTDRMPALARRAIAAACSNPDWALAILGLAAHYGRVAATTISETRCISSSAASDAARAAAAGRIGLAAAALFRRSVAQSLWALIEETPKLRRLARRRKRVAASSVLLSRDGGAD